MGQTQVVSPSPHDGGGEGEGAGFPHSNQPPQQQQQQQYQGGDHGGSTSSSTSSASPRQKRGMGLGGRRRQRHQQQQPQQQQQQQQHQGSTASSSSPAVPGAVKRSIHPRKKPTPSAGNTGSTTTTAAEDAKKSHAVNVPLPNMQQHHNRQSQQTNPSTHEETTTATHNNNNNNNDDDDDEDEEEYPPEWHQSCPLGDIMTPWEAATLLGPSNVRRLARAFRRFLVLSSPHPATAALLSSPAYQPHARNPGGLSHAGTPTPSAAAAAAAGPGAGPISPTSSPAQQREEGYAKSGIFCYDGMAGGDLLFLEEETPEEAEFLDAVLLLFFPSNHPPQPQQPQVQQGCLPPPPPNALLHGMWLDYPAFRQMMIPSHIQVPQGVLECMFTAAATHVVGAARYTSNPRRPPPPPPPPPPGPGPNRMVLRLADALVFLSIARFGTLPQRADLAFRIYRSVHSLRGAAPPPASRNGMPTMSRDTISRFIYNVYGNEVLQLPETRRLLDGVFTVKRRRVVVGHTAAAAAAAAAGQSPSMGVEGGEEEGLVQISVAELGPLEFVHGVCRTVNHIRKNQQERSEGQEEAEQGEDEKTLEHDKPPSPTTTTTTTTAATQDLNSHHLLTRWIEEMSYRMFPPPVHPTVLALEQQYARPARALHLLCARHQLTPVMLLECKRKFYSLLSPSSSSSSSSGGNANGTDGRMVVAADAEDHDAMSSSTASTAATTTGGSTTGGGGGGGGNASATRERTLDERAWIVAVSSSASPYSSLTSSSSSSSSPSALSAFADGSVADTGTFLPPTLAALTFRAGCSPFHFRRRRRLRAGEEGDRSLPTSTTTTTTTTTTDPSFHSLHRTYSSAAVSSSSATATSQLTTSCHAQNVSVSKESQGREELAVTAEDGNYEFRWRLYDFLQFGCITSRRSIPTAAGKRFQTRDGSDGVLTEMEACGGEEGPLLSFAFRVFCGSFEDGSGVSHDCVDSESMAERSELPLDHGSPQQVVHGERSSEVEAMSRLQIGRMLLLLLQHHSFRLHKDSPAKTGLVACSSATREVGEHEAWSSESFLTQEGKELPVELVAKMGLDELARLGKAQLESTKVNVLNAVALGLWDQSTANHGDEVELSKLIDLVLKEAAVSTDDDSSPPTTESLSFDGFVRWHRQAHRSDGSSSSSAVDQSTHRLGPYLKELRLLGGVLCGVRPSTPQGERNVVSEIFRRQKLRYPESKNSPRGPPGTVWFLISANWMDKWNAYSSSPSPMPILSDGGGNGDSPSSVSGSTTSSGSVKLSPMLPPPPRIDNNALLRTGSLVLRPGLRHVRDFLLVPPMVWSALQAWHDGSPPIHRKVVKQPLKKSEDADSVRSDTSSALVNEIELYPLCLTVALYDAATGQPRPFQQWQLASRSEPASVLLQNLCLSLKESPNNARLWRMSTNPSDSKEGEQVLDPSISLSEQAVKVEDGGILMLEVKDKTSGEWPRRVVPPSTMDNSADSDGKGGSANAVAASPTEVRGDGIVGLYNMGNTCYLNSSIQCLSHTPLLNQFFTSKAYLADINTTNPLGQQGRLAQVSATLVCQLWKAGASGSALTPKSFKDAIGKFNEHFAGNEQHDAQELLAFLLSGLSEDLNRIEKKPYIEQPDSDGRPDKELADIWWKNHLRREMSIIVALFTGQYKSLLTCKKCLYESARFEPFAFLQLPLPEDDLIPVSMILYPVDDNRRIMKYSVRVHKDGTIEDALISLAKILHEDDVATLGTEEEGEESVPKQQRLSGQNDRKIQANASESSKGSEDETDEEDQKTEEEKEEEAKCKAMADNLAVVDMRECRIHSITPSARSLSQVRESDVLIVFELEPRPGSIVVDHVKRAQTAPQAVQKEEEASEAEVDGNEEASTSGESGQKFEISGNGEKEADVEETTETDEESSCRSSSVEEKPSPNESEARAPSIPPPGSEPTPTHLPVSPQIRPDYIAVAQRRLEPVSRPYLHPFTMRVFGTPLLLRLHLASHTGRQLYDLIARRVKRFIPNISSDHDAVSPNGKSQVDDSSKVVVQGNACCAKQTDEFDLNIEQGRTRITLDREDVAGGVMPRHGFRLRLAAREGRRCSRCDWYRCCIGCEIPDDDDITVVQDGDTIVVDWHLATPSSRHKPEGSAISAAKEQSLAMAAVERHRTCRWGGEDITLEECLDSFAQEEEIPEAFCSKCKDFRSSTKRMSLWRLPPIMIIHLKRFQFTQHFRRKLRNMVVFPTEGLDFSRIVASDGSELDTGGKADRVDSGSVCENGERNLNSRKDRKEDKLKDDVGDSATEDCDGSNNESDHDPLMFGPTTADGRTESLYDLYGVVHHLGALTGGHYVASVRSEIDGRWRLFNDAQVSEISSRDIVDASAYILFYVRRDVKSAKLEDLWQTSPRSGDAVTEEQIDKLVKQRERCVIS